MLLSVAWLVITLINRLKNNGYAPKVKTRMLMKHIHEETLILVSRGTMQGHGHNTRSQHTDTSLKRTGLLRYRTHQL